MAYTINNADGSVLTTISPLTTDTTTSLALPGYGAPGWGQNFNQNFVYLLQNFASPVGPSNPVVGQIWFNNETGILQIYTSTGWDIVATAAWLSTQGYITEENLSGYATQNWVNSQSFVSASILESYSFVTASYVSSQDYITAEELDSYDYVSETNVATAITNAEATLSNSYVTQTYFTGQNFVTQTYLTQQSYATEAYITSQNYVTSTLLSGYLTQNQTITVTGDATGSGSTAINLTLAATGVTAGTYTSVSVDTKGRILSGGQITTEQITAALGFEPVNSADFSMGITGSSGYQVMPSGLIIQWITGNVDPADNTTPSQNLTWALTFPHGLLGASVSTYIASGTTDDLWYQVIINGTNTSQVSVQRQAGTGSFSATTTPFIVGFGY